MKVKGMLMALSIVLLNQPSIAQEPIKKVSAVPSDSSRTALPRQVAAAEPIDSTSAAESPPAPPSLYSAPLEQALQAYRAAPSELSFANVLDNLRPVLSQPGAMRISAGALIKDNPLLADLKPRVIEANGARLWTFPRVLERNRVIVQWIEKKEQVVPVGRRTKIDTKIFLFARQLALPASVVLKEAGFISSKDGNRMLIMSGDAANGSLWLSAWRPSEGGWREMSGFIDSLPSFLTNNVNGQVGFKGNDLIFNVAKMVEAVDGTGNKVLLPEAESATYKFWLKATDGGFAVVPSIPDTEAFSTVVQFMNLVQQGKLESTKQMLSDPRLASIPKYLGLLGKPTDPNARVVQMSVPPGRGQRFRLTGIGKDELIFDVAKVKGVAQIKAIFIAPPDPFLQETARYFPLYSKLVESFREKEPTATMQTGAAAK